MKRKLDGIERRQAARVSAERLIASLAPSANSTRPAEVLLHELLVNKVEFEAQIDELKRTHDELEEARDRFEDLYNRSPVGYITMRLMNRRSQRSLSPGETI